MLFIRSERHSRGAILVVRFRGLSVLEAHVNELRNSKQHLAVSGPRMRDTGMHLGPSQSFRRDRWSNEMKTKWRFLLPPLAFTQVLLLAVPAGSLAARIRNSSKTAPERVSALPPDVREIVDEGILAMRREDWAQVANRFETARKLAPTSPSVLLNLGLAESKIPCES